MPSSKVFYGFRFQSFSFFLFFIERIYMRKKFPSPLIRKHNVFKIASQVVDNVYVIVLINIFQTVLDNLDS